MTSLLIMCTASEGIYHLYAQTTGSDTRVEYLSVTVKLITYLLALFLQIRQRRQGRLSSVKLTLFWTLMAVCECFASPLYNLLTDELSENSSEAEFVLGIVSLSMVVSEAFLSHFTDPQYDLIFADSKTDEYLTDHTSPLSCLLFSWINRMMRYGYKNSLTVDDLDALRPDIKTNHVSDQFLKNWNRQTSTKRHPSFWLTLVRAMWPWMLSAILLELIYDFISLVPPIVLDWLITYMDNLEEPWWHGPVYALFLFGTAMLANLLMVHNLNLLVRAAVVPRSGLKAAIYQKVFRLSLEARRDYSLGEICNLVTTDSRRIFELVWHINLVWSSPLRILLTLALLWRYLGVACLAGVAVMLALIPLTALVTVHTHRIQKTQMEWKDSRLRLLNEMLNGIKVLKLFAWEPPFMHRVREVRELETKSLKKLALLKGVVVFLWILAPFLVALCSFVTFVLLDEKNVLDPSIAFVSLTLFGRLGGAMSTIPEAINMLVQSRIASQRIVKFLLSEERDMSEQERPTLPGRVLELENASFSWGHEGSFLQDLNFSLDRGDLVAVVGRVGAGKSALLSAILGEMYRHGGNVRMQKDVRIAYVPQTAWIQNATLRQNVLFVSPMDKRKYDSVVRKCCLRPDLKMLPGGDYTEIGEKGVNLSGGQKQRVSLARAVYHEADLYLLDDPLSAVDAHVSKDIFADVVGPKGLLAQKTRILVTHDLSVLPKCDVILLMSEGRIVESGKYRDLLAREDGLLKKMVEEFAHDKATPEEDVSTPSPDPSSLTTEELIAQMRTIGQRRLSRTMSVESEQLQPSAAKLAKLIESERMEVGRVRAGVYCIYFRSAGLILTTLVIIGFAAHQAFEIGSNVWLSLWSVDVPLPDGSQDIPQRNLRMIVYGMLGFAHGICVLLGTVLLAIGSTRASIRLHQSMLYRVMRSPLAFFETTPLGRILNRFGKDIQTVDVEIPSSLSNLVTILSSVIGTLILICVNHPIFLLIMVPIALLYIFLQLFYIATSRQLRRLLSVTLSPVISFFSESVQGAGTVRAFGCKDFFVRTQHRLLDTNCKVFLRTSQVNRWLGVRLQLMGAVIVFIVAMLSVFQRLDYSAALVGLTLSYTLNVTELLGQMVMLFTQLETRMVSAERVDEYSTLEEEASWNTDLCHLSLSNWPSEGAIVFRGYRMSYKSGSESVLKGIDLEIPGGQKVGIVGRTGAGKSSLAQALFRVVEPNSGHLFIDGVDVAALGLHDLRSRITVIPQDPVLFGGDLRLNLDPQNRHTDREVLTALEMARLELTDEGLDKRIEESGENLSVGQRQQVCLARALLQRSRILVLDEATAAVDLETDRLIQETIREEFRNCTVITVAHRLHTVLDYDRILVMDQGRIAEDGPPAALLKRTNSLFRELARSAGLL